MTDRSDDNRNDLYLDIDDYQALLDSIKASGHTVLGPRALDGSITYGEIASVQDLPTGLEDFQEAGRFSLEQSGLPLLFGYGPAAFWAGPGFSLPADAGSTPGHWKRRTSSCWMATGSGRRPRRTIGSALSF